MTIENWRLNWKLNVKRTIDNNFVLDLQTANDTNHGDKWDCCEASTPTVITIRCWFFFVFVRKWHSVFLCVVYKIETGLGLLVSVHWFQKRGQTFSFFWYYPQSELHTSRTNLVRHFRDNWIRLTNIIRRREIQFVSFCCFVSLYSNFDCEQNEKHIPNGK